MKSIIKRSVALMLSLLFVLSLCACKGEQPEETTAAPTTAPTTTEPQLTDYNRLTGLDDLSEKAKGKRPVAIMINNINVSLPQYGIGGADLMFECLVEGGITRMMAVFADYTKVPNVCSVRSCRYYYPIFAYGLDAVYFCFGSNKSLGTATLKRLGIDYFDGSENYDELVFGRDPERLGRYSREHTAFVKGKNIPELLEKYKVRTKYKADKDNYIFDFRKPQKVSSAACEKVVLNFSDPYYSTFTYDAKTKKYLKQHSGKEHIDSATGKQLAYTNVFALETDISLYGGGPLVKMKWKGGTGYYLSYGTVQKIKWSKKSEDANIVITDTKGKEIQVNKGNSYFGFVNYGNVDIKKG